MIVKLIDAVTYAVAFCIMLCVGIVVFGMYLETLPDEPPHDEPVVNVFVSE